jgi:amidohydrolase
VRRHPSRRPASTDDTLRAHPPKPETRVPIRRPAFARCLLVLTALSPASVGAVDDDAIAVAAARVEEQVIAWRRDFHEHPELGNREFRTASAVAAHLDALGLEVRREVAHTGVVGVLRGAREGPVVALRADMDALPVTETVDLPFASKVRTTYLGREVGVMHACGHDAHTAILMGVAQLLSERRATLPGTVLFVFQPAEEGAPPGERGGAQLMLEEGAFDDPRPDAVFGLHVSARLPLGEVSVRPGGAMASSDRLMVTVRGRQTHAAYPWQGVDPIAVAARIVLALQAIPGRQVDASLPSIVSIGAIHGGVRHNIIPDQVELLGTIRALDPSVQRELHARIERTIQGIADSAGAEADVRIEIGYPITYNDPDLTAHATPILKRVLGAERVEAGPPATGAEDFSFYQREAPGVFFWLGVRPEDVDAQDAAPNHAPGFFVDEQALVLGVRALSTLAIETLER